MLRLTIYIATLFFIFINNISGQDFCPDGVSPPLLDPNWHPVPPRFEIVTELIASDGIMELSQAFSTTRDAIATSSRAGPIQFYWNFATNEQFEVLTAVIGQQAIPTCLRQVITASSQTSVLQPRSLIVKPSVLLGYTARNQQNKQWGIRYIGEGDLRGIPVSRFRSCFYLDDIQATVDAIYHVSNTSKFHAYLPRNTSIILQLDATVKNQLGNQEMFSYNVFRYSPNPRRREEVQALETPEGLFCPNRTQTLPVPSDIPDRVSVNSEFLLPNVNSSIYSSSNLYDSEFLFSRFDVWFPDPAGSRNWFHLTELHDFGVGLSYLYNHSNRQCTVKDIAVGFNDAVTVDDKPNLIQMGDPQHLFLMDDVEYQYTGEKRCRDRVWCHVWIAEKQMENNTVQHREWYWATRINDEELKPWQPQKLVIKQMLGGVPVFSIEMNFFNYRTNPLTVFELEFTLAECYRALGPSENFNLAVLSFRINNDKNYAVLQNINYLRLHIWETLLFTMFVRPTRISNLIVDQDDKDILVTFTLLDAPPRTGPVEVPFKESNLDTLIERLQSIIDSNGLTFRARVDKKNIVLRARPNSLNIPHRSSEKSLISTGPTVTGLWIGFIIIGLAIGGIGGFFLFQKYAK